MRNRPPATLEAGGGKDVLTPRLVRTPPIKLDTLRHVRDELGRVYREARAGKIPTQDATRLAFMLDRMKEMIVAMEIEQRLAALEALGGDEP